MYSSHGGEMLLNMSTICQLEYHVRECCIFCDLTRLVIYLVSLEESEPLHILLFLERHS